MDSKLMKAFLQDRRQQVLLGESSSMISAVTSGVPQGSVLGRSVSALYFGHTVNRIKASSSRVIDSLVNTKHKAIVTRSDHGIKNE